MKKTYKIIPTIILTILILPTLLLAGQHRVIRVVDGDTTVVDYKGNYEKVRLLCVNAPESVHPDKKQNIPMGKVASNYAKKRLAGRYVDLEFEGPFRGRYGRLLAYVIVDGVNFNLDLIRQGLSPYCRFWRKPATHSGINLPLIPSETFHPFRRKGYHFLDNFQNPKIGS